jgi:RNA polymerase sigma-70 factor (ECF subfamily)
VIPSDELLVRRYLRGDGAAFEQLVERYSPALFNLAYRMTQDRGEAEHVVQDTFIRAMRALKRVRTDQPLKPWLLRITLNLCRTLHHKRRALTFSDLTPEGAAEIELMDESPLPHDWAERQEIAERVRRAVAELPPAYRVVLTLRYNEELSYEDIARILELPLNTVRTHLFRAKALLRARLSAWMRDEQGAPRPSSEDGRP